MTYRAPVEEILFCARMLGHDRLARTERFAEATAETRAAIVGEAAKMCEDALVPVQRGGDLHPARLENGVVRCSPGYRDAYRAIAEGGWVGISADPEYGGMGLPVSMAAAVNEMMSSACLSLSLCPLMSQGQIEALEIHAGPEIRDLYLPKMISGAWTCTMNMTEPQAGSDVGALRTRAEPDGNGAYRITGQKIYISWGDHDLAENVCHLVLARLPDGPPGTKGISLFVVPKYLPDETGAPGVANALRPVGLERKLGLHGSPTAVMDYDGATGWMVGPPHGGMAAMFTMMNNVRLGVGLQGLGVAEAATQKAAAHAADRKQGRAPDGSESILGHADVRRMLLTMKGLTQAARAICYDCAFSLDMARAADGAEERAAWAARGAFLTPIAKAFGSDIGSEVADLGLQVHGGMGYIEETGAAQFLRDVRVTRIYEGTNGIQAMDLAGRKLMDGGAAAAALFDEMDETAAACAGAGEGLAEVGAHLCEARDACRRVTDRFLAAEDLNDRFAGAVAWLRMLALTLGAHYLARAALTARADGPSAADAAEREVAARVFAARFAPQAAALAPAAMQGAAVLYELDEARFSA